MTNFLRGLLVLLALSTAAEAQNNFPAPGNQTVGSAVQMCLNSLGQAVPFNGPTCGVTVTQTASVGTTGSVSASITASAGHTASICGFAVSATGSGAIGPITITNLVNGTQTYQATASATGGVVAQAQFNPCIPAVGTGASIIVATTADASATAVDVNVWGYVF